MQSPKDEDHGPHAPLNTLDTATDAGGWVPARYLFAILSTVGFAIVYGLKVNLSVAIVAMVNYTAIDAGAAGEEEAGLAAEGECPGHVEAHVEDGPLSWSAKAQGVVLGSYFWGYLLAQVPGALLSSRLSAKRVMLVAVGVNVACAALSPPLCLHAHYALFVLLRALQGLAAGVTFPAMHVMIAHWAPPRERGTIAAIIYAGAALGTVVSTLMAGYVAAAWGWEMVFYAMALLAAPWCLLWGWLAADGPHTARFISRRERDYIVEAIGDSLHQESLPFPMRAVFTSKPFWAIMVAHFLGNCGWYMILTELPSFMKHVLHRNMKENAALSSLPYFLMWLLSLFLGFFLDKLRANKKISMGSARKIANGIATVVPAGCLVGITFIGCNSEAGIVIIVASVTALGGMFASYLANHIDIAPNFAGMLMAITNTFATIPGIIVPVGIGAFVEHNQTLARWSIVLYTVAALYVLDFVLYTLWASGAVQPWNAPKRRRSTTQDKDLEDPKNGTAF